MFNCVTVTIPLFVAARPYSLVDCETQQTLLNECLSRELKRALDQCDLSLSENFKNLKRCVFIEYYTTQVVDMMTCSIYQLLIL